MVLNLVLVDRQCQLPAVVRQTHYASYRIVDVRLAWFPLAAEFATIDEVTPPSNSWLAGFGLTKNEDGVAVECWKELAAT